MLRYLPLLFRGLFHAYRQQSGSGSHEAPGAATGAMTQAEAYQVLGLSHQGATKEEIVQAHIAR